MVYVVRIAAQERCQNCLAIRTLFLSNGEQITPDVAYRWLIAGATLRIAAEGP